MRASYFGTYQNATRIYNPHPDPLEKGPPKRVDRQEQHLGEMVASSKKRVTWTFTLGESDTIHEIVLTHSVLSYKKSVQYDGRQMHFSSTATPGDWIYVMNLEGSNNVFEVRINESQTEEIPKYDFIIDRIPYRKWDVYRRPHKQLGGPTPTFGTPSHDAALATVPPVRTFGTHHWGSAGLQTPPAPQYQANEAFCRPQTRANRTPKPKREINLIDDDYVEDMTVSAPAAMFDPLVNVAAPPETASQPLNNAPSQPRQMQQANIPDPFAQVIPTHHQQRPSKVKPSIQNQNYKPNDASNATGGGMMQTTPLSWNNSMPSCVNGKTMEIGNSMMCTGMIPSATTATSALNISKLMAPEDVFSNLRPAETTIKEININAFDVVR